MTNHVPVIAIDGPSGAGKGTVTRRLASILGWRFLDSGALYRVLGLHAQRRGVALDDADALGELARNLPVSFVVDAQNGQRVLLDDEDVSELIRSESAGTTASLIAGIASVREGLLARQRAFRVAPGLIADGRDMGSSVFPDAVVKIFLTASVEERARRRYKQLNEQGGDGNISALLREIVERDQRDATRAIAPLKPGADAIVVDTSGIGVDTVVKQVLQIVEERFGEH